MSEKVCIVAGVGPGTGAALSRRFAAGGYRVAMLARDAERLAALEREIAGSRGYAVDVTDAARVTEATGWSPKRSVSMILDEVMEWLDKERATLEPILA